MNRAESVLLHIITIALTVTGLVYAAMHYLMKPVDPFSVVASPWEPAFLKAHILVAPALVLLVGLIAHSHILLKLQSGVPSGRRTGTILIALFLLMTISGYVLQIVTDSRRMVVAVHLSSGVLWSLLYLSHQIAAARVKRRLAEQAAARQRMQNGSAF